MNNHEAAAWKTLVRMGAREIELGLKPALDLRACRPRAKDMAGFVDAVANVVGRSGAARWHMDRAGRLVYVVADRAP